MTEAKPDVVVALDEAIGLFESIGAFAAAISTDTLPVGQSKVSMWRTRASVPAEYVPAIYRETMLRGKPIDLARIAPKVDWAGLQAEAPEAAPAEAQG